MMLRFGSDQTMLQISFLIPELHKISPASTFLAQRGYNRIGLCTVLHPDRIGDYP
jgi:hypothetical protein